MLLFEDNIDYEQCQLQILHLDFQHCDLQFDLEISTIFVQDNAIYISGGYQVKIADSYFKENFLNELVNSNGGAVFLQSLDSVLIENCQFIDHKSIQFGGAVYSYQINQIEIQNNLFYNNTAGKGGGAFVQFSNIVILQNSNFTLNTVTSSSGRGGGFYANAAQNQVQSDINVNGNYFAHNSGGRGSSLYISYYQLCSECIVQNNYFYDNYCTGSGGGGLYLFNSKQFLLQYNQYIDNDCRDSVLYIYSGGCLVKESSYVDSKHEYYSGNRANNGGGISFLQTKQITVYNMTLLKGYADYGATLSIYFSQQINFEQINMTNNDGFTKGGIDIWGDEYVYLYNCTFINNTAHTFLSGLSINNCFHVDIDNCLVKDNYSINRSGMSFEASKYIKVTNSIINNNIAESFGAGFAIQNIVNITISNITLTNNKALFGAGIYSDSVDQFLIQDILIDKNVAINWGAGMYMEVANNGILQNITLMNNNCQKKAGGGLYLTLFDNIKIINVVSRFNYAHLGAGGYLYDIQNSIIEQSFFDDNVCEELGAGIILDQLNNVTINDIEFQNNFSFQKLGGMMIVNSQFLVISNIQILNNTAQNIGGLYIIYDNNEVIIKDSIIQNNYAQIQSSGVYMYSNKYIGFQNTTFLENYNNIQVNSLSIQEHETISFQNCKFNQFDEKLLHIDFPLLGGLIYASKVTNFYFSDSILYNSIAQQKGGGVYLEDMDNIFISNSIFNNLKIIQQEEQAKEVIQNQQQGGGIYINTVNQLQIKNSTFKNCSSFLQGGALYLYQIINTQIIDSFFEDNKSNFNQNMSIYEKNDEYTLSQGGSIYYEKKYNNYSKQKFIINLQNIQFKNSSASSGGGALINFPPNSDYSIKINNIKVENCQADIGYAFRFLGSFEKQFQKEILSQITEKNSIGHVQKKQPVYFNFSNNERVINSESSQFFICDSNRYLIQGLHNKCEKCHVNGVCEGGYVPIYPKSKYWRDSEYGEDQIIYCSKNEDWCLGNDTCAEGYSGVRCQICDKLNDYEMEGETCRKCGNTYWIVIKIFIYYVCTLFILSYQVYAFIKKVQKKIIQKSILIMFNLPFMKQSMIPGLVKLLVTHFQIFQIATQGLGISFPETAINSIRVIGYPNQVFSSSVSCLWKINDESLLEKYSYNIIFSRVCILLEDTRQKLYTRRCQRLM